MRMRVAIVGAGIAGLTSALFLRQCGHQIIIYERSPALSEAGAGIQLSPNAVRLLSKLNLLQQILAAAFEPHGLEARRYDNDEVLLAAPGFPVVEKLFGARHVLIYRPAYQQILYDACLACGVKVELGAQVTDMDLETPSLAFRDAGHIDFDLIVGADGVNSFTRRAIFGQDVGTSLLHPHRVYRALISKARMSSIPYGRELLNTPLVLNWIGPRRHVVGYPVSKSWYNVALDHPGPVSKIESWDQSGSVAEMQDIFSDFNSEIKSVLDLIDDVHAWKLQEAPPLTNWAAKSGKVVLVGDAAHAMLPYAGQGGAQAVEDAAVLATCLEFFRGKDTLKSAVDAYYQIRKPRVDRIAAAARASGEIWAVEDGPKQRERDSIWKEMTERNRKGIKNPTNELDEVDKQRKEQLEHSKWVFCTDVEVDALAFLTRQTAQQVVCKSPADSISPESDSKAGTH